MTNKVFQWRGLCGMQGRQQLIGNEPHAGERVVERHAGQRLLVVAHVTPIKVLVSHAVGAPLTSVYRMELPPCSLTNLAWFPDGNASMFSFAEAQHLRDVIGPTGT